MIQLGDTKVSLERREAFRQGIPVRLGCRAFDLLEALMAAPNRLLTKDELISAVWPQTIVEENNLQVQISALRKALGLDRNQLETIPGRGYRLNLAQPVPGPMPQSPLQACMAPGGCGSGSGEWHPGATVHVVDDEPAVRAAVLRQLRSAWIPAVGYESADAFLARCAFDTPGCLLLDMRLSEGSGFDLQDELTRRHAPMPILFMSGFGTIDISVRAMKAGAEGFLTKPLDERQLFSAIHQAMDLAHVRHAEYVLRACAQQHYTRLTERERQIFKLLLRGKQSKQVAAELALQEVTIKVHKKHIMTKLNCRTLVDLLLIGRTLNMLPNTHQHAQPA
jgi:FixJ family two-component response regulator